ncbi:hypothetical protein QVD17_04460 [Tagetes erecta]|uniref:Uncharacterized protein n=1 Tax=Tagetes erecta TaxID=13708 RepID=A0AAD8LGC4_TARER|nr:hypothetical protein QVD17_04460 [Tagetes erecta]
MTRRLASTGKIKYTLVFFQWNLRCIPFEARLDRNVNDYVLVNDDNVGSKFRPLNDRKLDAFNTSIS